MLDKADLIAFWVMFLVLVYLVVETFFLDIWVTSDGAAFGFAVMLGLLMFSISMRDQHATVRSWITRRQ